MSIPSNIRETLKEILVQALEEMKGLLHSRIYSSWKVAPQITIEGEGAASKTDKIEPDFSSLSITVINEIIKRPIFETFCKTVESDKAMGNQLNKLVGTTEGLMRISAEDILRSVLIRYLEKNNKELGFSEDLFDKICNDLYGFFSSETLQIRFQAILENFEMNIESVELDAGISIRQFRPGEVEKMWNKYSFFREAYPFWSHLSIPPAWLQGLVEIHKNTKKLIDVDLAKSDYQKQRPSLQASQEFDLILTTLRLLKSGSVKYGLIITRMPHLFGEIHSLSGVPGDTRFFGKKFILENSDIGSLKSIWQAIRSVGLDKNKAMNVALRRLNFATERLSQEDKLIDTMIAFEALILSDAGEPQDRGELRHRLSTRVAHLLGQTPEEMQEIYKRMKKAYDLRSKVVHGETLNQAESENVEEFLNLCRRTAREMVLLASRCNIPEWDRWLFE